MTDPLLLRLTQTGKRRCQATAPVHGDQCTKLRKHNKTDNIVTHQAGCLVWADAGPVHKIVPDQDRIDQTLRKAMAAHPSISFGGVDLSPFVQAVGWEYRRKHGEELIPQNTMGGVDAAAVLAEWWRDQAEAEIAPTVDKAVEYGSTDLIDIGMMLGRTMGRDIEEEEAAELGVFFYLIGKIARWQSAIQRGERPSDDTLFDIGVYVRMAQRIRKTGGWPGVEQL